MSDSAREHSPFPHAIPDVATARRCVDAVVEYLAGKDDSPRAAADLRESVRLLSQPGTWLPIETAPKDGTVILGYGRGDGPGTESWVEKVCWFVGGDDVPKEAECWTFDADGIMAFPEGWMPLPPAPVSDPKE